MHCECEAASSTANAAAAEQDGESSARPAKVCALSNDFSIKTQYQLLSQNRINSTETPQNFAPAYIWGKNPRAERAFRGKIPFSMAKKPRLAGPPFS